MPAAETLWLKYLEPDFELVLVSNETKQGKHRDHFYNLVIENTVYV